MLNKTTIKATSHSTNNLAQPNQILQEIKHHQNIVKVNPDNTKSWLKLANLYRQQCQTEELANCFKQLIKIQPQEINFYRSLAEILKKQEKTEQLITICQQAINLDPKQPLWMYKQLTKFDHKDNLIDKAINTYQKAIASNAKQPSWVYLALGNSFLEKDCIPEAIATYQQGLKIYPQHSHFYLSLGNAHQTLQNYSKATKFYRKSILIKPLPTAYIQLGNIYQQQNQIEKAIDAYQQAISIKPTFWAYVNLGNVYQDLKDFDQAIQAYNQAKKLEPKNDIIYVKLGNLYQKQKQWHQAIASYQQALPISKNRFTDFTVYREIKNIYLQQDNIPAAINAYKQEITKYAIVNQKYKIIYIPISKNACTLFTTMMVEQSDEQARYHDSEQNIYTYSQRYDTQFIIPDFSYFHNQDYFKFTILRNPFGRLLSGYLDKIVKYNQLEPFAKELIQEVQDFLKLNLDLQQSITFRQFILYLANTEDFLLNEHWRSQHTLLGREFFELDYLGQFEQLDSVIKFLENKFNFTITTDVQESNNFSEHITEYVEYDSTTKFCDTYPTELKFLKLIHGGFPEVRNFYTPELVELVKKRFATDIEIYQQQFGIALEEMIPD